MAEPLIQIYCEYRTSLGWRAGVFRTEIPDNLKARKPAVLQNIWRVPDDYPAHLTVDQIREIAPGGKFHWSIGGAR